MSSIQFPDAKTIEKRFYDDCAFWNPEYTRLGITKAVAELAAKRFAGQEYSREKAEMNIQLMMFDLERGKDGYEGEKEIFKLPLGNIAQVGLLSEVRTVLLSYDKSQGSEESPVANQFQGLMIQQLYAAINNR